MSDLDEWLEAPLVELKAKVRILFEAYVTSGQEVDRLATFENAKAWLDAEIESAGLDRAMTSVCVHVRAGAVGGSGPVDHSEVDVFELREAGGRTAPIAARVVGDWWGPGLYRGVSHGEARGPERCLLLSTFGGALRATYVGGHYGTDWVCHNITLRFLLGAGLDDEPYADIRGWKLAVWAHGPEGSTVGRHASGNGGGGFE